MAKTIVVAVHPEPGKVIFIATINNEERLDDAWRDDSFQEIDELDFVNEVEIDREGDLSIELDTDKINEGPYWIDSLSRLVNEALYNPDRLVVKFVACGCSQPAEGLRVPVSSMSSSTKQFSRR